MKHKLFILLMITGISQCTEILSSYRNRPYKTQQQIEQEKATARREKYERTIAWEKQDPAASKATSFVHKNRYAALAESKKTNNHDSDRDYESDDSDASGIHFKFGPTFYSVHRISGCIIKTQLIKEDRLHKFVNNLEMTHDTLQKFHGMKLCADELKDLLEIEKEERP